MSSLILTLIVFISLSAGAFLGMGLRRRLPAHHLDEGSKDVVRVAMSLVATMAALVLGLLVTSAKGSYDNRISQFNQLSANIVLLDAALGQYGPETKEARDLLRRAATSMLARAWPQDAIPSSTSEVGDTTMMSRALYARIQELTPQNDMQRRLQTQALAIGTTLGSTRWLLAAQQESSIIPMPFMVVLVFWLSILFASFGLFAPFHATIVATISLCALSVSGAIFLILELARPFDGIIQISSAPLRYAISQLGQ